MKFAHSEKIKNIISFPIIFNCQAQGLKFTLFNHHLRKDFKLNFYLVLGTARLGRIVIFCSLENPGAGGAVVPLGTGGGGGGGGPRGADGGGGGGGGPDTREGIFDGGCLRPGLSRSSRSEKSWSPMTREIDSRSIFFHSSLTRSSRLSSGTSVSLIALRNIFFAFRTPPRCLRALRDSVNLCTF